MDFRNQVVVVTGAGGGLGRAYALAFAAKGAKVVVNDVGGKTGDRAADKVVREITQRGGTASPNYDSVESGHAIIETAIRNYGKIDVLINNAGILRDLSFSKMTEKDWDAVIAVHLKGSFSCSKAAWPYMMKQQYGRIVNTASAAGLYGNFGQSNYSAAKMALVGFTRSLAREGEKKNVLVNVIAPLAGTAMTATILPKEILDALKPEAVAPLVLALSHSTCRQNGQIFEVGAGWIAKVRWQRTKGARFSNAFGPEEVAKEWQTISDFSKNVSYPDSLQDSLQLALAEQAPKDQPSRGSSSKGGRAFRILQIWAENSPKEVDALKKKNC